jgi:hypothetical protein
LRVEVIVVPLNVVVCPDGLTKDTPAGVWVNTTGNPTFFHIPNNCLEETLIRTNNDIEGYHNDLNTQAVIANPPFYLLCRLLHRESSLLPVQVKQVCEAAGVWVNTTGNPTFFHIPNNCLEETLCSVL